MSGGESWIQHLPPSTHAPPPHTQAEVTYLCWRSAIIYFVYAGGRENCCADGNGGLDAVYLVGPGA